MWIMDRIVKFRGKDIVSGEWHYGGCMPPVSDKGDYDIWVRVDCGISWQYKLCQVKPDTIGQFTGLKDSSGIEIYEGDIIMSYDSAGEPIYHEVFYDVMEASFLAGMDGRRTGLFGVCNIRQSWIDEFCKVVVGNVHDNPELLKCKERVLKVI